MKFYHIFYISPKDEQYFEVKAKIVEEKIPYDEVKRSSDQDGMIFIHTYLNTGLHDYLEILCPDNLAWSRDPYMEPSKKEIEEAEWLEIRPKYISVNVRNLWGTLVSEKHYSSNGKAVHFNLRIEGDYSLNKYTFPKSTHFEFGDGASALFISPELKEVLENSDLRNLDIHNTYYKGEIYDKVYELRSKTILKDDILIPDVYTKIRQCPVCSKKQYHFLYQINVKKEIMNMDADFFMTDFMFSENTKFFISHRFYEVLKEHKMTRSIVLEPLNLL